MGKFKEIQMDRFRSASYHGRSKEFKVIATFLDLLVYIFLIDAASDNNFDEDRIYQYRTNLAGSEPNDDKEDY